MPDLSYEKSIVGKVVGVDEVGYGTWAGPVMACATYIPLSYHHPILSAVQDSKKLSAKKRREIFDILTQIPEIIWYVGHAEASEIDEMGLGVATHLAMKRAVEGLSFIPDFVLVDGNRAPKWHYPTQTIIEGDQKSLSIAAASIIAKVTRDQLMCDLHTTFPTYKWNQNAGYGTALHQQGLQEHGVSIHHRKSFKPIQAFLASKVTLV